MSFFLVPLIFIFCLYLIANLLPEKLNLNNFEKPIFSLGIIILLLNYFYFNFNIKIQQVFYLIVILTFISIFLEILKKNYFLDFIKIAIPVSIIAIPLTIYGVLYGEQYYVFRGNIYDHFIYLSSGLSFFNYKYIELIEFSKNFPNSLSNEYYLQNILHVINSRPSAQLLLGFLINLKFIDIIKVGYIFKIITSALVSLAGVSIFFKITKNLKYSILISTCFVFSFFYFYNYEIDAFSLILSTPFLLLIFKYSIELPENIKKSNNIFLVKFVYLNAVYFIIYPNGGAIIAIPLLFFIISIFFKQKLELVKIMKLGIFFLLFGLFVIPTFNTTIMYLYSSEISVGLSHKVDYWGYYGAFIFGKDNPIHNSLIVSEIKSLWATNVSFISIIPTIIKANINSGNNFFFLNIIPSAFGYYHLTTSEIYGFYNYILVASLFYLNIAIIKRITKNTYFIFKKNDNLVMLLKIFIIYFLLFSIYLISINQIWSAIKLYFVLTPFAFLILIFDFSKIKPKFNNKFLLFLLVLLPLYKYSDFNHGIGRLDSFPSVIKKDSKIYTKWNIKRSNLFKCDKIKYNLDDKFHKIYISLIFKHSKIRYGNNDCNIELINGEFVVNNLK